MHSDNGFFLVRYVCAYKERIRVREAERPTESRSTGEQSWETVAKGLVDCELGSQ